jgi:hypothetical protein
MHLESRFALSQQEHGGNMAKKAKKSRKSAKASKKTAKKTSRKKK